MRSWLPVPGTNVGRLVEAAGARLGSSSATVDAIARRCGPGPARIVVRDRGRDRATMRLRMELLLDRTAAEACQLMIE